MIEIDARMTKDGILIVNHDEDVKGFDLNGAPVKYIISDTDYDVIKNTYLHTERKDENRIPTLEQALNLAYFCGMC